MKKLSALLALLLLSCTPTLAPAAAIRYQNADNINETPVSQAAPLPVDPNFGVDAVQPDISITANAQSTVIDTLGSGGISLTVSGTFVATVNVQWSNKVAGPWASGTCTTSANLGTTVSSSTINAPAQFVCYKFGRYANVVSTAYTSGTATITPSLLAQRPGWASGVQAAATAADGGTLTSSLRAESITKGYNGATEDLWRANYSATVQTSAAQTVTNSSAAQVNYNNSGVSLFVNVTAVSGTTPTMTCKLQVQEPVAAGWVDLPGAATASITTTGTYMLQVYPGIAAVANQSVTLQLPRSWRATCTIGGTTPSFTYSIGAQYNL